MTFGRLAIHTKPLRSNFHVLLKKWEFLLWSPIRVKVLTEEVLKSTLFFSFYTYISFNTIGKRNECLTWSANI